MSTIDKIAKIRPSENSGAMASNRFAYQINWGLKKLLELETNDEDYIMVLDYHDDIVICNSEKQEDYVDFYQIKTRNSGNWTLSTLRGPSNSTSDDTKADDGKTLENLSIIAKLINHTNVFDATRKLYFVTNSRLADSVYGKGDEFVEFNKLKETARKSIIKSVIEEIGDVDESVFDSLVFIQNQMSVNDYANTVTGALSRFLKEKFEPVKDVTEVYENIISMMNTRTYNEFTPDNNSDFKKSKTISHSEFREYLEGVSVLRSYGEITSRVIESIKNDVHFGTLRELKSVFSEIATDILNYENNEMQTLIPLIRTSINEVDVYDAENLWDYTNLIYARVTSNYDNYQNHSELYLKAVVLYVTEKYS